MALIQRHDDVILEENGSDVVSPFPALDINVINVAPPPPLPPLPPLVPPTPSPVVPPPPAFTFLGRGSRLSSAQTVVAIVGLTRPPPLNATQNGPISDRESRNQPQRPRSDVETSAAAISRAVAARHPPVSARDRQSPFGDPSILHPGVEENESNFLSPRRDVASAAAASDALPSNFGRGSRRFAALPTTSSSSVNDSGSLPKPGDARPFKPFGRGSRLISESREVGGTRSPGHSLISLVDGGRDAKGDRFDGISDADDNKSNHVKVDYAKVNHATVDHATVDESKVDHAKIDRSDGDAGDSPAKNEETNTKPAFVFERFHSLLPSDPSSPVAEDAAPRDAKESSADGSPVSSPPPTTTTTTTSSSSASPTKTERSPTNSSGDTKNSSPLRTIPSFNDFHRLKRGEGLGWITVSPVRAIKYDSPPRSDGDDDDQTETSDDVVGAPMRCYDRVRGLFESLENRSAACPDLGRKDGGAESDDRGAPGKGREEGVEPSPDDEDHQRRNHGHERDDGDRRPKISNFSTVAPVILAELRRKFGGDRVEEANRAGPTVVTSKDLAEIRDVIQTPAKLNPLCPKDILESDLDRVKGRVDALIDDGFQAWKKPHQVASDLVLFLSPMMMRHADYDKDRSLFRKLMEEVMSQNYFHVDSGSAATTSSAFIAGIVSTLLSHSLPRLEADQLISAADGFRAFELAVGSVVKGTSHRQPFFNLMHQIVLCTIQCSVRKPAINAMALRYAMKILLECSPRSSSTPWFFYSRDEKCAFRESSEEIILSCVLPRGRVTIPESIDFYFRCMKEAILDISVEEPTRRHYLELMLKHFQS